MVHCLPEPSSSAFKKQTEGMNQIQLAPDRGLLWWANVIHNNRKVLDQLSNYQLLKKISIIWSFMINELCWLTCTCCMPSCCIWRAILCTKWLVLLYMMELRNMSITSRWNSAVVRVTPSSMFFLIVDKSMGLQGKQHAKFIVFLNCWSTI